VTQATRQWLIDRLLAWYDDHARKLPWRAPAGAPASPYEVLLSEFMLQQTTVATIKVRYPVFLARFPGFHSLAAADESEVLHAWQGLGYYRRARALHACARAIVERHRGRVPSDQAKLRALPGIGPYTASALRAIVHEAPSVPVDGNVMRIMARLHRVEAPLPHAADHLRDLARGLACAERPGHVAQALMDLGATVCRPRRPACLVCPWRPACRAHLAGVAEQLPRRVRKRERPVRRGLAFLLARADGAILFRRRPPRGLLGGLHELPSSPWQEGPLDIDRALTHAPSSTDWRLHPNTLRHAFTHFVLELALAEARIDGAAAIDDAAGGIWCPPAELDRLALPTLMKKLLRLPQSAAEAVGVATALDRAGRRIRMPPRKIARCCM
jgi:A/G-specific adenine glycosylase